MGCDIHSFAQAKGTEWKTVTGRLEDSRDYDTFAVLADVRNGSGFAGVVTGDKWHVMYPPRGLPEGLEVNEDMEATTPVWFWNYDKEEKDPQTSVWLGDHSFSWLLLSEIKKIKEYYQDKSYVNRGCVTREQFIQYKEKGIMPESWSAWVSGNLVNMVGEDEADLNNPSWNYVRMQWQSPALDNLFGLEKYIEELEKVAMLYGKSDDEVRLVFGFDS